MQKVATTLDTGLVPLGRLGAALHAHRDASKASVSGISRASDGRYLPDRLITLERGDSPIDDEQIVDLVGLYALAPKPLPLGPLVEVFIDRSTGLDAVDRSTAVYGATDAELVQIDVDATIARFIALSVMLCLDITCGPVGLDRLGSALHLDPPELSTALTTAIEERSEEIVDLVGVLSARIAVPSVGILVANVPCGSLLLVKRHRAEPGGPAVPPCGPIGALLDLASGVG